MSWQLEDPPFPTSSILCHYEELSLPLGVFIHFGGWLRSFLGVYLSWWKFMWRAKPPELKPKSVDLLEMVLKMYMALWSFLPFQQKEFWKTSQASRKFLQLRALKQGRAYTQYSGVAFILWLSLLVKWSFQGMVWWDPQLCWGLKEETGIWLVNTSGRKELDSYWLSYRSTAGSAMGENIYFTHILYDLGGIRGNSIRKWLETFKTLI